MRVHWATLWFPHDDIVDSVAKICSTLFYNLLLHNFTTVCTCLTLFTTIKRYYWLKNKKGQCLFQYRMPQKNYVFFSTYITTNATVSIAYLYNFIQLDSKLLYSIVIKYTHASIIAFVAYVTLSLHFWNVNVFSSYIFHVLCLTYSVACIINSPVKLHLFFLHIIFHLCYHRILHTLI